MYYNAVAGRVRFESNRTEPTRDVKNGPYLLHQE